MKFYTPFWSHFNGISRADHYSIFHASFFASLLPIDKKLSFFLSVHKESRPVFSSVFNVEDEYVNDIKDCDCVILTPMDIRATSRDIHHSHLGFIERAQEYNKPVVFFSGSDYEDYAPIDPANLLVFQPSGTRTKAPFHTLGLSTVNEDFFDYSFLPKDFSIGFCGYYSGHILRSGIIESLKERNKINFILREGWHNTVSFSEISFVDFFRDEIKKIQQSKKEHFTNMRNNLYNLCVRGGGNFSFRLGETFMMGRIPILIDSDCLLPFADQIPYKTNTVYITRENSNNYKNVYEMVCEFHESHTEKELIEIQKDNRNIWLRYFTPKGIFDNTKQIIEKRFL